MAKGIDPKLWLRKWAQGVSHPRRMPHGDNAAWNALWAAGCEAFAKKCGITLFETPTKPNSVNELPARRLRLVHQSGRRKLDTGLHGANRHRGLQEHHPRLD